MASDFDRQPQTAESPWEAGGRYQEPEDYLVFGDGPDPEHGSDDDFDYEDYFDDEDED
ncbi:MAG: hypothetical protein GY773_24445, partial [Actinomycetia bacterium]|nr:hypothetical protein [Actinomycetes bacterium]